MLRMSTTTIALLFSLTPCMAQETAGRAVNGDVEIAYWAQGPEDGVPLVLVNGQGAATRVDDDAPVDAFAAKGY